MKYRMKKALASLLLVLFVAAGMLCGCTAAPASGEKNGEATLQLIEESSEQTEAWSETDQEETSGTEEFSEEETSEEETSVEELQESTTVDSDAEYLNADGSFKNGSPYTAEEALKLRFRKKSNLDQHYEKHGIEMGFADEIEYRDAAAAVVANPRALHKLEQEDGDDVYYIEESNEFVVVSKDGYLRTYFNPSAGIKYYNKQ